MQPKSTKKRTPLNKKKQASSVIPSGPTPKRAVTKTPRARFGLSGCAMRYLSSLWDPFEGPIDACVPVSPGIPSQRVRAWARGAGATGSSNFGFVLARHSIANDVSGCSVSGLAYTGTAGTTFVPSGTGIGQNPPNVPYATANIGLGGVNSVEARIVSYGIRVRYTGTELNCGGTMIAFAEPDNNPIDNNYTYNSLLNQEGSRRFAVKCGEWVECCWIPSGGSSNTALQFTTTLSGNYNIVIALQTAVASQTFDFEYFINLEYIGTGARGKIATHIDTMGTEAILGALNNSGDGSLVRTAEAANRDAGPIRPPKKVVDRVIDYATDTFSFLPPGVGDVAKNVLDLVF